MADRYFLSIAVGPNPRHTRPLVATEDPDVVRAAVAAFVGKLPGMSLPQAPKGSGAAVATESQVGQ